MCVERCEGVEERRGGVVEVVGVDRTFVYIERRVREKDDTRLKIIRLACIENHRERTIDVDSLFLFFL